jgi:hypothetical protein
LFKAEQEAISGNNYTYQRLLNETLILNQRYLRRARKLTTIGDDEKVDVEQRIEAHKFAAQLERAVHDMSYIGPSYLKVQGLLPEPKTIHAALTMSKIEEEEQQDPSERQRMKAAGEYRRRHQQQRQQQEQQISNPSASAADTYNKIEENKKKIEKEQDYDELDDEEESEGEKEAHSVSNRIQSPRKEQE